MRSGKNEENSVYIRQFVKLVLKNVREEAEEEEEPFNVYAKQLHRRIFDEIPDVEERCVKGYQRLFDLIQSGR